jgi:hypothetical protein
MTTTIETDRFTADALTLSRANDFIRFLSCLDANENRLESAKADFALRFPRSVNRDLVLQLKAGVTAGTTHEPGWTPLAQVEPLQAGFLTLARPLSLLGKIPGYREAPFNTSIPAMTSGPSFAWTGQAAPKNISAAAFQSVTLPPAKATGTIIVTAELLKLVQPASVTLLRNDLARGLAFFVDQQLIDHTIGPVLNVSPGAITNAAPSFGSSGSGQTNVETDLRKLYRDFFAVNKDASSAVVVMSPANAATAADALKAEGFGADGGRLWGALVVTSAAAGNHLVMLDPQALAVAEGGLEVSVSSHASVELDTSTTSPATAGVVLVSLWANNLSGIRCERMVNWRLGRADATLYTVVNWV